ncbi:GNAT family N-acetyltransferase [Phormidium tenue FACHB-886]|nr:GNAT family N-acetyltransferase [Phormidium tenue FACHB-886]
MSPLHQNASLSQPWLTAGEPVPSDSTHPPCFVRTVRKADLAGLSDILASSFHSQDGTWGWLYPLLRMGIYEDLRTRIQTKTKHYICLVAAYRVSETEAEQEDKLQRSLQLNSSLHPAWSAPSYTTGGDRPIGTVEVSVKTPPPWQSPHTRYVYLSNLAVHTDFRRRGLAQQMLQMSERVALDWGFEDLYLHVLENNHTARRLYLRAGYRLMRVETNVAGWLIGRPRQLFMHKHLSKDSGV